MADTVHAVELTVPNVGNLASTLRDKIDQGVFDTLLEALPGEAVDPIVFFSEGGVSGDEVIRTVFRVDPEGGAVTKTHALDKVENVIADLTWYQIAYHDCNHIVVDRTTECPPWGADRTKGTVPAGVAR